jgi:putative phosphoesterase
MSKVLLLSDTHSYLDEHILEYVGQADEVWHAGDVGQVEVIDQLMDLKPVRGVYGNIDGTTVRAVLPEKLDFELNGLRVHMRHIGGYPPRYAKGVSTYLTTHPCDLFICGHSHILKVMRDSKRGLLHMNPGAAGKNGFHKQRTMLRFQVKDAKVTDLEVIELLPRY